MGVYQKQFYCYMRRNEKDALDAPRVGPKVRPMEMLITLSPNALPRSEGAKVEAMRAGATAWIMANPMPWSTLTAVSWPTSRERPHKTLANVKTANPPM